MYEGNLEATVGRHSSGKDLAGVRMIERNFSPGQSELDAHTTESASVRAAYVLDILDQLQLSAIGAVRRLKSDGVRNLLPRWKSVAIRRPCGQESKVECIASAPGAA